MLTIECNYSQIMHLILHFYILFFLVLILKNMRNEKWSNYGNKYIEVLNTNNVYSQTANITFP